MTPVGPSNWVLALSSPNGMPRYNKHSGRSTGPVLPTKARKLDLSRPMLKEKST